MALITLACSRNSVSKIEGSNKRRDSESRAKKTNKQKQKKQKQKEAWSNPAQASFVLSFLRYFRTFHYRASFYFLKAWNWAGSTYTALMATVHT